MIFRSAPDYEETGIVSRSVERLQKTMPALISIAAAPVAPHGAACRHGSSGIGVPVGGSIPFGGVCLFSDHLMESKPPAGPPAAPSRGLQSSLSLRSPEGGSVRCAPPLPGFLSDRKGSAGLSRECPARIRFAWDSPPAGAALMRSGRLIGVRSLRRITPSRAAPGAERRRRLPPSCSRTLRRIRPS